MKGKGLLVWFKIRHKISGMNPKICTWELKMLGDVVSNPTSTNRIKDMNAKTFTSERQ